MPSTRLLAQAIRLDLSQDSPFVFSSSSCCIRGRGFWSLFMKKIAFTSIFGSTDTLKEPIKPNPSWDYVCFTDDPNLKSDVWSIEVVPPSEPKKQSRYYKIRNHFPAYDLSVWVDATFQIKRDLDIFALTKTSGIWMNRHPMRQCAYEEAEVVKEKNLADPPTIDNQVSKYEQEGFPHQWGLWRCGIIVRNPQDALITNLCETWYNEIEQYSYRDQISLPYACWKTGIRPNSILKGITENFFKQSLHLTHPTDEWKYVGEGDYDHELTIKYQGAHLIILKNGLLFPQWVNNYISLKHGRDRFIELIKILNGVIVYA